MVPTYRHSRNLNPGVAERKATSCRVRAIIPFLGI